MRNLGVWIDMEQHHTVITTGVFMFASQRNLAKSPKSLLTLITTCAFSLCKAVYLPNTTPAE